MLSRKVLVTGALGQLGSAVLESFDSSWKMIPTDFLPVDSTRPDGYIQMDISDTSDVKKIVEEFAPDIILNLAAMTDVDGCELYPEKSRMINEDGVRNLLNNHKGIFVQISTDYVFDGKEGPYSETDPVSPVNEYGRSKLNAERLIQENSGEWIIIRTNVLYDYTKQTKASFVKWVVDSLRAGKKINVVDDQYGNPTWTIGLSNCISKLLEKGQTGLFNYAGKDYMNRLEFAKMIADIFNLDSSLISPISTSELKQAAMRPLKSGLITDKIENVLNLKMLSTDYSLKKIREKLNS